MVQVVICLWMVQKFTNLWTDNMKITGFNRYVYDFSIDYDATDIDDIKDIHKHLMTKNNIV